MLRNGKLLCFTWWEEIISQIFFRKLESVNQYDKTVKNADFSLQNRAEQGFSVLEVMLALAFSSVMMVSVVNFVGSTVGTSQAAMNSSELRSELESSIDTIGHNLEHARFVVSNDKLCALFTDTAGTPNINANTGGKHYGFRLFNNIVQAKRAGSPFTCDTAKSWENITDSRIQITALNFIPNYETIQSKGTTTLALRSITINLSGQLATDAYTSMSISKLVDVR
jgi:type II secretory pathway component PulJ